MKKSEQKTKRSAKTSSAALDDWEKSEDLFLNMADLRINKDFKSKLLRTLERETAPLVLLGANGLGKKTVCRACLTYLLCEADRAAKPCGSCESCRILRDGWHFDLTVLPQIFGVKPEDRGTIAVADVREHVAATILQSTRLSAKKVYVLCFSDKEAANTDMQNALLKALEEHPDFVRFIMLAERKDQLLPTIISRSTVMRLPYRSEDEIHDIISENLQNSGLRFSDYAERFKEATAIAPGNPGRIWEIMFSEGYEESLQSALKTFYSLLAGNFGVGIYNLQQLMAEKATTSQNLQFLAIFLRELMMYKKFAQTASLRFLQKEVLEDIKIPDTADYYRAVSLLTETARALSVNTNRQIVATRLCIELRKALGLEM